MNNPCQVIAIANQKGGVGKTTTVMNLGVALKEMGHRVLLIDGDPQANLTSYLGVESPGRTLEEVFLSKKKPIGEGESLTETELARLKEGWVQSTPSGVDLLASDRALSGVEFYLFSRADKEQVLNRFLRPLHAAYDYILIDTPPSLNLLTINALVAARWVVVPVQPEFFSLEGVVKIRQTIQEVRERWNPELEIAGVLGTQVAQRRRLTQEIWEALAQELGPLLFEALIHDNAAVTESSGHAQSVIEYQRASRGAQDYLEAAAELTRRLAKHQPGISWSAPAKTIALKEEIR